MTKAEILKGMEDMRKVILSKYEKGKNGNGVKIIKESSANLGFFFVADENMDHEELQRRYDGLTQFIESWTQDTGNTTTEFTPSDEWEERRQKLISDINGFKNDMVKKYGERGRRFVDNGLQGSF